MLIQHIGAVAVAGSLATSAPAPVGDVVCDAGTGICVVVADRPGPAREQDQVRPVSGRGQQECQLDGRAVPCRDRQFGRFNRSDGCYYRKADPAPPPSDPVWEGRYPDGAVYLATCPGTAGTGGGWVWRATPPPDAGGVTAATVAARAVSRLRLTGPAVGTVPAPGHIGLVGMPVWLWTDVTPRTWGPASATASVPGLSVTATARASRIEWDMGDGSTVRCANPGTPYKDSYADRPSPTCGHIYTRTSARQPGKAYSVTATTTWLVTWTGGGESGQITLTRPSTTRIRVGELQVLVQ